MKNIALLVTAVVFMISCKKETKNLEQPKEVKEMAEIEELKTPSLKETALKAQDAFFKDYSAEGIKKYFTEDYIQHNPHVPTGRETVLGFLKPLKQAGTTSKTHRILQDGDFIILHNSYDNAQAFGGKEMVAFDVWRMENGKVAEHWDNLTPKVTETVSGRSQVDGPTEVIDLDKTEANKNLVKKFVDDVLFGKAPEKITDYVSTEQYDQHNPLVKDGLEGLNEAIQYLTSQNNMFIYKKVHKVLGEGNFVLTMSEGEWGGKPQAFYDLFRVNNGKIVEHWDVIQEIPEKMAHENGKF